MTVEVYVTLLDVLNVMFMNVYDLGTKEFKAHIAPIIKRVVESEAYMVTGFYVLSKEQ